MILAVLPCVNNYIPWWIYVLIPRPVDSRYWPSKQTCAVLYSLLYHVARMATPWGGKLIFWFVNDTKLSPAHPGWMLDAALQQFWARAGNIIVMFTCSSAVLEIHSNHTKPERFLLGHRHVTNVWQHCTIHWLRVIYYSQGVQALSKKKRVPVVTFSERWTTLSNIAHMFGWGAATIRRWDHLSRH